MLNFAVHRPQLQSLSTKNPPPMLELLDCHVPGSQVTVRYALKARRVSAPRMHDLLVKAITFTFQQRTESGQAPDPTFEFDGVGANKWYFIDVEETSDGALTWDNLSRTFEGLLICVFHRRLYYAIRFEIWEGNDTDAIHVGTGEFDTLRQTALQ